MHFSEQNKPFLCASYTRLSQDDGKKEESNSIVNQKYMIRDYISDHSEFTLVQEYSDDGYSGTNFDRPGFRAMMEAVKQGQVNCIIVKDLSRFGRNYIETGKYLEQIFPFLGVRFIAINDHVDTGRVQTNAEQFVLPFKNLINDSYCKDLSIKVRSQLAIKRKKGDFVGSFATYGYKKDPEDHNHLVVDQEASVIVRNIFEWKICGLSAERIADKLNGMGVLCPMEYKLRQGLRVSTNFRNKDAARWVPGTVLRILKNELYTGVMVQGKITTPSYKMKQQIMKPESDWDRVEGAHEAIIPKNVFDMVQDMMLQDTRISPKSERVYLFSGFLHCADCKRNMIRRVRKYKDREYAYYACAGYRSKSGCSSHNISEALLYDAVLSAIQQQFCLISDLERLIQCAQQIQDDHVVYQQFEIHLAKVEEEIRRSLRMKDHLVEDLNRGVLSRPDYLDLNVIYDERIQNKRNEKRNIEAERDSLKRLQVDNDWLESFRAYPGIHSLDRTLLATLVQAIEVHSGKQITVHFRFEDQIKRVIRCLKYIDPEITANTIEKGEKP